MPANSKSESAFLLAMDLHGFSSLSVSDHDKVITHLYPEIAKIVHVGEVRKLTDRKTIGDGFMFYFSTAALAAEAAIHLQILFVENRFWKQHKFERHLECRIGLHAGQFFRMKDAIEERPALFGRNIIAGARLEPVVGHNEIWCTASFKAEFDINGLQEVATLIALGKCQLAKSWAAQDVFALYVEGQGPLPKPIRERHDPKTLAQQDLEVIPYKPPSGSLPSTYFALIRLKHRSDGIAYLRRVLTVQEGFQIEAIYYIFGAYDIIVRFRAKENLKAKKLSKLLSKGKIIWAEDKCELTDLHFEGEPDLERIVEIKASDRSHLKAFTYIKSNSIAADPARIREVVAVARKAFKKANSIVTYYHNDEVLILPIAISTDDYYTLAKAIEDIESLVDKRHWKDVSIITYPVHGFEEQELFKQKSRK